MKRLAALALVAGCGRFGFAERDATIDDGDDTDALNGQCTAHRIANFDYGLTGATDLAAAQVPNGYAVAAVFGASTLWGVALDASLTANTDLPFHTTPVAGFDGSYTNGSLYFDGTNLDGSLSVNDGTCFLKTFLPDMTGFISAPMRTGQVGAQSIARANGSTLYSFWFHDVTIQLVELMADGTPKAPDLTLTNIEPANIVTASAADGPAVVLVWELASGACRVAAIASTGGGVSLGAFSNACHRPYLDGDGTDAVAVYENAGQIHLATMTVSALPTVIVQTDGVIGAGSDPRVFRIGTQRWGAWRDSSRLHVVPLATLADTGINNAPSGPPDAYEPAGPYVFAIWGSQLWAITCP